MRDQDPRLALQHPFDALVEDVPCAPVDIGAAIDVDIGVLEDAGIGVIDGYDKKDTGDDVGMDVYVDILAVFEDGITDNTVFFEVSCLIVSSYRITPPIHSVILVELNKTSLNNSLFSGVDGTFTLSNLLVIVPVLSSAAKIPFPFSRIFRAMLFNSDILV